MAELARFCFAVLIVLAIPGLAILAWLPRRPEPEFLAPYALGLGLAATPLIYLGAHFARLPLSPPVLWLVWLIFAAALLWRVLTRREAASDWLNAARPHLVWVLVTAALGLLSFLVRWWPMRGFPVPLGADSPLHAVKASLFVQQHAIPTSYRPYYSASGFTYHFGMHAASATLAIAGALPVHRVQIFLLPFVGALAALSTMVLAERLTHSRHLSVTAAVIVAFVSPFPAWFPNWGRLPLAGALALLPLVLAELVEPGDGRFRLQPALWLLTAGMVLSHYRTAVMLGFALGALILVRFAADRKPATAVREVRRIVFGLGPAFLIAAPWVLTLLPRLGTLFSEGRVAGKTTARYNSFPYLSYLLGVRTTLPAIALAAAGAFLSFVRKQRDLVVLIIWPAMLLAFVFPYFGKTRLFGLIDVTTWSSMVFIPGAILGAFAVWTLATAPSNGGREPLVHRGLPVIWILAGLAGLLGAWMTGDILRPQPVRPADIAAFGWIKSHTRASSKFLSPISVPASSTTATPTDSGAWLVYFTLRGQALENDLVPVQKSFGSADSFNALARHKVTHLFFGTTGRPKGRHFAERLGSRYRLIYDRGGVLIFELAAPG